MIDWALWIIMGILIVVIQIAARTFGKIFRWM